MPRIQSRNNFDLLRLFAASQVALIHLFHYFDTAPVLAKILSYFPGVPVFFFISGFLIVAAYEKSSLRNFAVNRILRLYPALFVCFGLSVGAVWMTGYYNIVEIRVEDFLSWVVLQLTIGQFMAPAFMQDFGVGTLNTPLWTISVEMQFYLLMPCIGFIFSKNKGVLITIFVVFIIFNIINTMTPKDTLPAKMLNVSFLPWVYMFLLGGVFYKWKNLTEMALKIPFVLVLVLYLGLYYLSLRNGFGVWNNLNPPLFLLLSILVLQLAFKWPGISDKILNKNDYSYGIYIYHMPIVNVFVYYQLANGPFAVVGVAIFTCLFAVFSWHVIERPCLSLKRASTRR